MLTAHPPKFSIFIGSICSNIFTFFFCNSLARLTNIYNHCVRGVAFIQSLSFFFIISTSSRFSVLSVQESHSFIIIVNGVSHLVSECIFCLHNSQSRRVVFISICRLPVHLNVKLFSFSLYPYLVIFAFCVYYHLSILPSSKIISLATAIGDISDISIRYAN